MIGRLLKFGLLAGAFFVVAGISAYFTLTFFISSETNTVVPDLSGKHVVTALELLSDLSLNTKVGGMEYSADIPIHHVITQDPTPGFEIKPGRDVRITLSKGPETVVVPSLKGLTLSQAHIVLDENGLLAGNVAHVYQDRSPDSVILSQIPVSGKTIHREQKVDLLISRGKRPHDFMMPDLSGLSIEEAIKRMERLELALGTVDSVTISSRASDQIIDQSPSAGHRVVAEDIVDLTINRDKIDINRSFALRSGLLLLRHTTDPGFLNRHIRVRLNSYGLSTDLVDTFIKPGSELWCFVPTETNTTAFLYEDDELIKSEVIE
jgi:serine/threonine-protein kinase